MKPVGIISAILGLVLFVTGLYEFYINRGATSLIPCVIGASLIYLGYRPGRTSLIVFGHVCIVVGCFLTTLGIYLVPESEPTAAHILLRPLFWGLFSIFGGFCAIFHGFCRCVNKGRFDKKS
jgi:hypothetical protein